MPNAKPALLIVQPHLGFLGPILEPDFTVWRFWEGPPIEAVDVIRALVVAGLNAIPGVCCTNPAGAFYAFPRIALPGMTSAANAKRVFAIIAL